MNVIFNLYMGSRKCHFCMWGLDMAIFVSVGIENAILLNVGSRKRLFLYKRYLSYTILGIITKIVLNQSPGPGFTHSGNDLLSLLACKTWY